MGEAHTAALSVQPQKVVAKPIRFRRPKPADKRSAGNEIAHDRTSYSLIGIRGFVRILATLRRVAAPSI
jgi:hypothetical protein